MFSEILKIIPKLDNKDLNNMERTLGTRFGRVAKKFGRGVLNALAGGGLVGIATGFISKILNPLEAVQEAIEKSLKKGDDLVTYAKQFNTTEGNLSRLQAFGKATGLEPEGVRLLLEKFQSAVAKAAANPQEPSSVSAFVGRKDTAEAFFEFVQSMQKLNSTQKSLVQQEVFGERQILKASEFLNADFRFIDQAFKSVGVPSTVDQTSAAQFLGQRSDNLDILHAAQEQRDLIEKAKRVTDQVVSGQIKRDELDLKQENKALSNVGSLQELSFQNQKLINEAVNAFLKLAPLLARQLTYLNLSISGAKSEIKTSRMRGVGKDTGN